MARCARWCSPTALHAALISRLKIMADLDIGKRLPQDGRISLRLGTRAIDVRVSTLPSAHGERAVLRLLDKSESHAQPRRWACRARPAALHRPDRAAARHRVRSRPHGLGQDDHAVRQPLAPGRHAQQHHDGGRPDRVRAAWRRPGDCRSTRKIDLTFAPRPCAPSRQDPDIIMIGEIRDFETAQIAIQASLTGHLVLATLHTNDAASAVTRLTDMGVEPFR